MKSRLSVSRLRESYVDTLSKLYHYSTSIYEKNRQSVLTGTDLAYTYGEFKRTTDGISKILTCYGIGAGSGVAILSQNHPNWGVAFFSAAAFGRVAIPILPDSTEAEVTNILTHSEAKAIFVSRKFLPKVSEACREKLSLIIDIETLEVIKREEKSFTCDGRTSEPGADDLAALIYTSGTTGSPKGVMLSHRNLVHNIFESYHCHKTSEKDTWLSVLPMAHTYEMSIGFLYPFYVGACVYYLSRPLSTATLLPVLKEVKPTTILTVPLIIEKIVNSSVLPTIQKSKILSWMDKHLPRLLARMLRKRLLTTFGGNLRFFGIGGAKLNESVELFLRRIKFPYAIGYGLTECAPLICTANPKQTWLGSCGCAAYGVDAKLIDVNPETGEGELVARGDMVMLGYYKDPVRTKAMFTEDGYLKTNDLAWKDEKGRYYIRGRLNNMIVGPSGENIYPEEIEMVINDLDSVSESIVVDRDGKLVALVQLDENAIGWKIADEEKLFDRMEEIRKNIASQVNKVVNKASQISKVVIMKEPFEKTATMKVRRFLYRKSDSPKKDAEAAKGAADGSGAKPEEKK